MRETMAVGVDLGGTKIASALVTSGGRVLAARHTATGAASGPEPVLDRLAGEVRALLAQAPGPLLGVGIGSPGQVIANRGVVRRAVNLGWDEVDLAGATLLRLDAPLPVLIQKDANASALGEYYFGAARGCADFVYLSVGTGLGCGLVSGGRLVTGASWLPSDLGHLSLDPDGRQCACGLRGCAETLVSGPGLVNLARLWLTERRCPSCLKDGPDLTSEAIVAAARRGDPLAGAVFARVGAGLGQIMAVCVSILNPARIVLGGGLALAAFDLLVPPARLEMQRRILPWLYASLEILPSQLTTSAVGPACLVWYGRGDPVE